MVQFSHILLFAIMGSRTEASKPKTSPDSVDNPDFSSVTIQGLNEFREQNLRRDCRTGPDRARTAAHIRANRSFFGKVFGSPAKAAAPAITKAEVAAAQDAWAKGIVDIGAAFSTHRRGAYSARAGRTSDFERKRPRRDRARESS